LTSKRTVFIVLPIVAIFVVILTYLQLFSSTLVIAILVVLYAAVSLRNRKKFSKKNEARQTA
jgi:positive regulator of sigma E activity